MSLKVDDQGNPPSMAEILRIVQLMREYISGDRRFDQQNAQIDSETCGQADAADIARGMHRYIGSRLRAERIETFCNAVEHNLQTQGHTDDHENSLSVVKNPFKYFGFTIHPATHAIAHGSQAVTDRIMTLVVDVGKWAFTKPDGTPIFSMKGYTICHLTETIECHLGEELFCRIGGAYYCAGRGFNIAHAGSSTSGDLGELQHNIAVEKWKECDQFRGNLDFHNGQLRQEIEVNLPAYQGHLKELDQAEQAAKSRRNNLRRRRDELKAAIAENNTRDWIYRQKFLFSCLPYEFASRRLLVMLGYAQNISKATICTYFVKTKDTNAYTLFIPSSL
ncbi:hypothetical protein N0V83_003015 [Neocucurbitaria cava]|uniref:Uncharacterized protein n=1 Tax=Neocucurbitaria cava TaxID=798079 RepID=A0A9W8YD67_9PLEO|nr:hypothetical protein N0V83_003015 [Neocucurbitaria cava]